VEITPRTLREAAKITGLELDPAELRQAAPRVHRYLEAFGTVAEAMLAHDEPPGVTFDPRLPGMSFPRGPDAFIPSGRRVPPLPDSEEDIAFAPVVSLAEWLRRRALSSERLTTIYLERLNRLGPRLECVVTLLEGDALRAARRADRELDAGRWRGPLHGVPWGAKDLLDTRGVPTSWGAEPYRDRVPDRDAEVVRRLRASGAVLLAKLSLGALANGDVWFGGKTRNPFSFDTGSSGSSAGSAAAVAAGLVGFAIGSETHGSIVSPSATCGNVGLRPTFGRVSRAGAMPLAWSLDKLGPMTRTVEDAATILTAIVGREPEGDPADPCLIDQPLVCNCRRGVRGLRVGYERGSFASGRAHAAHRRALGVLRDAGADIVPTSFPDIPVEALRTILTVESAASFDELTRSGRDDELTRQDDAAWPNSWRATRFVPAVELVQAERLRGRAMRELHDFIQTERLDALLSPDRAEDGMMGLTNFTGHPSLTVRVGMRRADKGEHAPAGRPVALNLWGRLFEEETLVRLGLALERRLDVYRIRPLLP
jgi:Asp-tRNA(Asn)/Glu-tRNA(Gln) amidotransferase A subunit family amidase